jgi:murein DD-endopeptidase MepM/ murein hydrolase activator NlpD
MLPPELIDETIGRNDLSDSHEQQPQQGALLLTAESDRSGLVSDLERSEDPKFLHVAGCTTVHCCCLDAVSELLASRDRAVWAPPDGGAMSKLNSHIKSGERTRTLFVLLASLVSALLVLGVAPAPEATASAGGYQWPVKPFDQPHPIRGGFGDPRTVFSSSPTEESLMAGGGKFNFHFGVDIWAPNGTAVYPVVSGTVSGLSYAKHREYVEVLTADGRSFQYWHIWAAVRLGQSAEAGETILGRIMKPFEHVHFAEIQNGRILNPLAIGHLTPYADTTKPEVESISLRRTETGSALMPNYVQGRILMVAEAYDTRQLRIPGVWQPMPVAPARIAWRLRGMSRKTVARGLAADFRTSVPSNAAFWSYYARGTYQNMSVFGSHYSWGQPGCFLFKLTHSAFDTESVRDGVYDLIVTATDIAGNSSSKSLRLTVHNGHRR